MHDAFGVCFTSLPRFHFYCERKLSVAKSKRVGVAEGSRWVCSTEAIRLEWKPSFRESALISTQMHPERTLSSEGLKPFYVQPLHVPCALTTDPFGLCHVKIQSNTAKRLSSVVGDLWGLGERVSKADRVNHFPHC